MVPEIYSDRIFKLITVAPMLLEFFWILAKIIQTESSIILSEYIGLRAPPRTRIRPEGVICDSKQDNLKFFGSFLFIT